jgi:dienelactone hydrolase
LSPTVAAGKRLLFVVARRSNGARIGQTRRVRSPWKRLAVVLLGLTALVAAPTVTRLWRAQRLLRALAAAPTPARDEIRSEDVLIPRNGRPLRARLYMRDGGARGPGLVVAHGVHHQGIDERRLVPFVRELARAGLVVLTPALDDLADYRIDARSVTDLGDAVKYLGGRTELLDSDRVGLLGFSFGGGLALLAAGEPGVRERVSHVVSIGGYHDLARVLGFFVTGVVETPEGPRHAQPNEYGPLVLAYRHLDRLVPAADGVLAHEVVRAWLHEDLPRARALAAGRTSLAAEHLFASLEEHDFAWLRPALAGFVVEDAAELERLSPRHKLARILAPVYLLHGSGDSVIPPSEARWADAELGAHEHAALVTPLLEHVEVAHDAGLGAELELLRFMAHVL